MVNTLEEKIGDHYEGVGVWAKKKKKKKVTLSKMWKKDLV